jgi:hypothetical protein
VVVKREKALEKEHHEEAAQQPHHSMMNGIELMEGVQQHAQQRQPEPQSADEADGNLQACVHPTALKPKFSANADGSPRFIGMPEAHLLQFEGCLTTQSSKMLGFLHRRAECTRNVVPNSDGTARFSVAS